MTKLVIKKEKFERLVEKYYKEVENFIGTATAVSKNDSENWYQPLVKVNGYIEMGGSKFAIERSVNEGTLKEIIKYFYEKDEKVDKITFNLNEGIFDDVIIEIKGKVKKMKLELGKKKIVELLKEYYGEMRYKYMWTEVGVDKRVTVIDKVAWFPRIDKERLFAYEILFGKEEEALDGNRIFQIIRTQLEKKGYEVGKIRYKPDKDEFGIIEVTIEEKNKGVMDVKNLKMYEGCLIVVDMVNGFVREGVLHDEKIADIIPRQIELIKEAKHEGKLIVFIKDTHDKDAVEFERFGNTKHCVEGEKEAELVDELKEYEKDGIAIPKNSTCFMEAPLFRELMEREINMNDFDIVGCCTDICVVNGAIALANYLDQNNRKHNIRVHEDAIATYAEDDRKEYVEAAKLLMKQQGIELVKKGR